MFIRRVWLKLHNQSEIDDANFLSTGKIPEGLGGRKSASSGNWNCAGWQLGVVLALGMGGAIAFSGNKAIAQIVPDNTLGNENSLVSPTSGTFQIDGGATRDTNLFHSFSEFSVPPGTTAFFNNNLNIQNIISRVTGSSISNINGTLKANGAANLFLINPNGIVFGQNARLELGGSFVASTANSLNFADGTQFSTTNPQAPPLLTVSVPNGLQFGTSIGNIRVEGQGLEGVQQGQGLQVKPGRTLALIGGNVILNGGILQAPGGRIELGSVGAGTVNLDFENLSVSSPDKLNAPALSFNSLARGDVTLANGAILDVVGNGGGDITLTARNISISGDQTNVCAGIGASGSSCKTAGSALGSSTSQAGNISFDATETVTIKQSRIENNVNPDATGNSGDIFDAITNRNNLFGSILIGGESISISDDAAVSTSSFGQGSAGIVFMQSKGRVSVDNSGIFSNMASTEKGNAGGILIDAGSIYLNNSQLRVQTDSSNGDAGIVSLQAKGGSISSNQSLILSDVRAGAVGNARGVKINGGSVSLTDTDVSSSTYSQGDAGAVLVTADNSVTLVNTNFFSNVESGGNGQGGEINVTTGSLSLLNGSQLQTIVRGADDNTPAGIGNAGKITVTVRDAVITGVDNEGKPSLIASSSLGNGNAGLVFVIADRDVSVAGDGNAIVSEVLPGGLGNAGGVGILARTLFIRDGARVSVNNLNEQSGEAGVILIRVRDLRLENQGQVSAVTLSGQGGDIDLGVRDLLVLTRNSDISTTAGIAPGGGDGGNITVNSRKGYIFGVPVGDNNFTAQAYLGNGGSISIDAAKVYKIDRNSDDFLNTNDITVSSRYGRTGISRVNDLNVDPTQGFTNLPVDAVDTSRLIAQRCALRSRTSGRENKFVVTGPGGLPPSPNDTLQNESVVTNWVSLEPPQENPSGNPTSKKLENPTSTVAVPKTPTYVEAQGWVIDEKGEVILTAQAPTVTPHNPTLTPANVCNGS